MIDINSFLKYKKLLHEFSSNYTLFNDSTQKDVFISQIKSLFSAQSINSSTQQPRMFNKITIHESNDAYKSYEEEEVEMNIFIKYSLITIISLSILSIVLLVILSICCYTNYRQRKRLDFYLNENYFNRNDKFSRLSKFIFGNKSSLTLLEPKYSLGHFDNLTYSEYSIRDRYNRLLNKQLVPCLFELNGGSSSDDYQQRISYYDKSEIFY
jgi:hypothetical protein